MSFISYAVLIVVVFAIAMYVKSKGIYWLQIILGIIVFGLVGGCITDLIFGSFKWGFLIMGGVFALRFFADLGSDSSSGSSDGDYGYASGSSRSSGYSSGSSSWASDSDDRRSAENRSQYERLADEAYSHYRSYLSDAESYESQADTEMRYAEDYDYRAREYDDSSARSQASSCRSSANYNMSRAREARSKADYYYSQYQDYKERARTC